MKLKFWSKGNDFIFKVKRCKSRKKTKNLRILWNLIEDFIEHVRFYDVTVLRFLQGIVELCFH